MANAKAARGLDTLTRSKLVEPTVKGSNPWPASPPYALCPMHTRLLALTVTVLAMLQQSCAAPRVADTSSPESAAVMAPVRQFVNGFNAGDTKSALAACADAMSIIDEFPPYEWHGAGALSKWISDYDADAKKNGITEGVVTIGEPRHVDITADRAYVVIPADYAFQMKGTLMKESGSMFTFALHKGGAGWRITGWSWSKN